MIFFFTNIALGFVLSPCRVASERAESRLMFWALNGCLGLLAIGKLSRRTTIDLRTGADNGDWLNGHKYNLRSCSCGSGCWATMQTAIKDRIH